LLATALPGAFGAVDVVVAGDAGLESEVLAEVAGHALGEQLLPAVAVLGVGGVGVLLLEGGDVGVGLLVAGVDAGRGGVEEAADLGVARSHGHVGGGQHRERAQGLVVLDEAHAAHVAGEVVDLGGAVADGLAAGGEVGQVPLEVLGLGVAL